MESQSGQVPNLPHLYVRERGRTSYESRRCQATQRITAYDSDSNGRLQSITQGLQIPYRGVSATRRTQGHDSSTSSPTMMRRRESDYHSRSTTTIEGSEHHLETTRGMAATKWLQDTLEHERKSEKSPPPPPTPPPPPPRLSLPAERKGN